MGSIPPAVLVIRSIQCLRYQSCEANDYTSTVAAGLLDWIESHAVDALCRPHDAPWGWTRAWADEKLQAVKERIANAAAVTEGRR